VEFFLQTRGLSVETVRARHDAEDRARKRAIDAIPPKWRRSRLGRADLPLFVFEPDDIVLVVGQDGLVANVAKYLNGQRVIGANPDPERYDGVLVRHAAEHLGDLLAAAHTGRCTTELRTMVEARLDDGQRLLALNEVFVGHVSHQSARYRLRRGKDEERQSSSGIIVATGTGSTGWARSIERERPHRFELPKPCDSALSFFVREAFPSVTSGVSLTDGLLRPNDHLELISEMNDGGVLFGDGIEYDRIEFGWGMRLRVGIAEQRLALLV
jgi:hypothetical protein